MWSTIDSRYREAARTMTGEGSTLLGERRYEAWLLPLIAEFIGQFFFTFFHSMTANAIAQLHTSYPLLPALTDGLFLLIIVICFAPVSGAHVNPAVSTAFVLTGNMNLLLYPCYIIVQLTGSIVGAELSMFVAGKASGAFVLGAGVTEGRAVMCEVILTFLLVLVILLTAVDQCSPIAPVAIGLTVVISIIAGRGITGACMNPSLSLGPAVVSGAWASYWVYWVGPLFGAMLAAAVYKIVLASRSKRLFCNNEPEELYDEEEDVAVE